jgi:hypothetical protein
MLKLYDPTTYGLRARAHHSWLSEILDSFVHGIEGQPPVPIDTSKPVGAALAPLVSASQQLGAAVTGSAETAVNAALETYVGPAGTSVADLFLNSLIAAATAKLTPTAKAASPT